MAAAGNGAKVSHIGPVTYSNSGYVGGNDSWTCSGAHIVKTAPHAFIKDSETCVMSGDASGLAGVYMNNPLDPNGPNWGIQPGFSSTNTRGEGDWISDYNSAVAISWTMTVTLNADGVTYTNNIVAYYAS